MNIITSNDLNLGSIEITIKYAISFHRFNLAFDDNPLKKLWNHAICHSWNIWQRTINDQLFV